MSRESARCHIKGFEKKMFYHTCTRPRTKMSRLSLFVCVVALAVYCADSVPIDDSTRCTVPGQVWDECPEDCDTRCPEAIPADEDCLDRFCKARCVCLPGYVESKEGLCVEPLQCETMIFAT